MKKDGEQRKKNRSNLAKNRNSATKAPLTEYKSVSTPAIISLIGNDLSDNIVRFPAGRDRFLALTIMFGTALLSKTFS